MIAMPVCLNLNGGTYLSSVSSEMLLFGQALRLTVLV